MRLIHQLTAFPPHAILSRMFYQPGTPGRLGSLPTMGIGQIGSGVRNQTGVGKSHANFSISKKVLFHIRVNRRVAKGGWGKRELVEKTQLAMHYKLLCIFLPSSPRVSAVCVPSRICHYIYRASIHSSYTHNTVWLLSYAIFEVDTKTIIDRRRVT